MPITEFYLLDVGMGDSTFIIAPDGKRILIDLGSTKNRAIVKEYAVPFIVSKLNSLNPHIDLVIFTHGDIDHYNQFEHLIAAVPTITFGEIYFGGSPSDYSSEDFYNRYLKPLGAKEILSTYSAIGSGDDFNFGGLKIKILGANFPHINYPHAKVEDPDQIPSASAKNAKSVVTRFEYGGVVFIFPGDAIAYTEKKIIALSLLHKESLRTRWLKLAHHGSDTSSCDEWIDATQPGGITISADNNRTYGLPKLTVIQKYDKYLYDGTPENFRNTFVAFNNTLLLPAFQKFPTTKYILGTLEELLLGVYWNVTVDDKGGVTISRQ